MCGRFVRTFENVKQAVNTFGLTVKNDQCRLMVPNYNIYPTEVIAILSRETLLPAIWGFCPDWLKDKSHTQMNARLDTLFDKPMFRGSAKQNRCLIPASGYYEWSSTQKGKQPYYIYSLKSPVFFMAGIYTDDPDGNATVAIVTKGALGAICEIADRMPLSFDTVDACQAWLKDSKFDQPMKQVGFHAISSLVNSPTHNSAELIEKQVTS